MANNPIYVGNDGDFVDLDIPTENLNDDIKVTIKIELLDEGWKYDSVHIMSIQGNTSDLYNSNVDPVDFPIGTGKDIIGKRFRIFSHIIRLRNGSLTDIPSKVKYTLMFNANESKIAEFDSTSDRTNPVDFISDIKFV